MSLTAISTMCALLSFAASAQTVQLALVGGTIYVNPQDPPIRDGIVTIRDGRIAAIGPRGIVQVPRGVTTLDCHGLTITAGFWNSHVHFMENKWSHAGKIPRAALQAQLEEMLTRFGATSVFDTGSDWANTRLIRDRIAAGEVAGPRIRSTGDILFPKGGSPPGAPSTEIGTAQEARDAAKRLLDEGTDGIKLYAVPFFAPNLSIPGDAINAATSEAHQRGKLAFAHPTNRQGLLASIRNGVDVIVHTTPQSGPWDEATVTEMKKAGIALIPTLKLWRYELRDRPASEREAFTQTGVGQLRAWSASGGVVLFGTDVGYMAEYEPSDEYALMSQAGMSFGQILAALTTAPAARFGESNQRGRIAAGMAADLVVLSQDPTQNARAFSAVRYTLREGKVIWRAGSR